MTAGGAAVSPLSILAWRQFPLRDRLAELDRSGPPPVDNDAKALALAEEVAGGGRGTGRLPGGGGLDPEWAGGSCSTVRLLDGETRATPGASAT